MKEKVCISFRKVVSYIIIIILSILLTNFVYMRNSEAGCNASGLSAQLSDEGNYWSVTLSFNVTDCGYHDSWWRFDMQPQKENVSPPSPHNTGNGSISCSHSFRKDRYEPGDVITYSCLGYFHFTGGLYGTCSGETATVTIPYKEVTCYQDADDDGCGNFNVSQTFNESTCPDGWVNDKSDCDDGNPEVSTARPCYTICGPGTEVCQDGQWGGCDAPQPEPEICDGKDNNCDGETDEGFNVGVSCDSNGDGFLDGKYECIAEGGVICKGGNPPSTDENANYGPDPDDRGVDKGEPVNITIGNAYVVKQDFYLPGRGLDIIFERTYNSRETYNGPSGYGWTHNYNIFLTKLNNAEIMIVDGYGAGLYFMQTVNGDYAPISADGSKVTAYYNNTYIYSTNIGLQYRFDNTGKLLNITDRNSNTQTFDYDGYQRLISVADSAGREISFDYDADDRICAVYGPTTSLNSSGIVAFYSYDTQDNLIQVTYPDGSTLNYNYNDPYNLHNLTSITDKAGKVLAAHEYDGQDRAITSYSEGDLWKLTFSYDSATQTTVYNFSVSSSIFADRKIYTFKNIKGINVVTDIRYQEAIRLVGSYYTYGSPIYESFTWDDNLRKTAHTDKRGYTSNMSYDDAGNLLTKTDPLGNTTTYTYEPTYNQVETITDSEENTTAFEYDVNGNLIFVTDPIGNVTTYEYNSFGQVKNKTDAKDNKTSYQYDTYGNLTKKTNSLGQSILYTYDNSGNRLTARDVNGKITNYKYNIRNRLIKITHPDGGAISYQYDDRGNIVNLTDAQSNVTQFSYDILLSRHNLVARV